MAISRTGLIKSALVAAVAAGSLAAAAKAETYVVCNRWDECWRVHERYTTYPTDARIVWHDDAWRASHEHDAHWKWLSDPADDHGWYDQDGKWHAFAEGAPPPPQHP